MSSKGDTVTADTVARFMSTKHHSWRGKYSRMWALSPSAVQHVDPSNFTITNTWPWTDVLEFTPAVSSTTEFSFTVRSGKKSEVMKFSCDTRTRLLMYMQKLSAGDAGSRRFVAVKMTRASSRLECGLELGTWYLNVLAPDGRRLSHYPFDQITSVRPLKDDPSALLIYAHGRPRLFATPERSEVLRLLAGHLTKLGMTSTLADTAAGGATAAEYRAERLALGSDGAPKIGEFEVLKLTGKYSSPRTRRLVVTETSILERDSTSYAVISARPLTTVFAVVRHWDEPQKVTLEYKDGSARTYMTSLRDALLGAVLDSCRNVGNGLVSVNPELVRPGDRLLPLSVDDDADTAMVYIKHLEKNVKPTGGPFNAALVRASAEFNANTSVLGLGYGVKKHAVSGVLPDLVTQLNAMLNMDDFPTALIITLLQALMRIVSSAAAAKFLITLPEAPALLLSALRHEDDGVVYWAVELLRRLFANPRRGTETADEDSEATCKKMLLTTELRVAIIQALDVNSGGGASAAGMEGTLVMMTITNLLDSLLVSGVDTTPADANDHLMQLVASRYAALLALFRCQVAGVVESSAMLMRAIVDQADTGTCRAMQSAALSSGVWLRHFYNALFAPSLDQRYVSRYLLELWSTGNATAREVLRHMLPAGVLLYLEMPKLTLSEAAHLEGVEAGLESKSSVGSRDATTSVVAAPSGLASRGLAHRLRSRLEQADVASTKRVKRRLAALDEAAAGAKRGRRRKDAVAEANMAAAAAAAVTAQAAMTRAKIEEGKTQNYSVFFFQLLQDHVLPDLIWNQQTRAELRAALEAELREIEREIELGGQTLPSAVGAVKDAAPGAPAPAAATAAASAASTPAAAPATVSGVVPGGTASSIAAGASITGGVNVVLRVAWNFAEFEVEYPSLTQELRVGDYYLRLFLEAGEASVGTLREPGRFFDALYRRVLRETAPHLKCMCLRGMTRVYERHHDAIGAFEDTDYMVYLLSTTTHNEVRDRLLLLILALSCNVINCEKMINPDCLELLVDLLTTAHTTDVEKRAMPVLSGGGSLLLLQNGPAGGSAAPTPEPAGTAPAAPASTPDSSHNPNSKESLKVWHYRAAKADLAPGEKAEKGPYSLQDMARLGEMKKVTPSTLVWAQGMREWVRMDALRAVMWFTLSEGTACLAPAQRGEVCVELLRRLATLRPSLDAEGAPVRPVPKAKRVLCGPRTLPHIVQALLAGSPKLVDLVAQLVVELVRHNPKAMIKLYMTGVFFFVLGYSGSNWTHLSQLLALTHLGQSFHSDAASLASESPLAKRSILGSLLPESMICVLEARGHKAFGETFLANVDTPEVIWKYSMRGHLLDMVSQHLGDLPARLSANPCTLYDYCPVPPIKYEELENELWCHNFYLANLCDEARFPEWPIADAVGLLRAVLDAWRAELTKKEEKTASPDDAYVTLGVPAGSAEAEIRKAYRKLAIKFHPDKNPAGREMFEKIQKAYDLLTSARGPAAAAGTDAVAVLLMVRTQCILFKRHAALLKAYKYAGYPLVLESMQVPPDERIAGERATFLEACTRLVYLTCLTSPKNAEELVRENGTESLMYILSRLQPAITVVPPPSSEDLSVKILENVLHTLSGLATMKDARERILPVAAFPTHLVAALALIHAPKVMQHGLDTVARLAVHPLLQDALLNAGMLFRIIPLLFRFDATMEAAQDAAGAAGAPAATSGKPATSAGGAVPSGPASTALVIAGSNTAGRVNASDSPASHANEQRAANMQAKLTVRALGRLGGYLDAELATPKNPRARRVLAALLTPSLAKRLSRPSTEALLKTLNGHEESAHVVWTAPMRKELLSFVATQMEATLRTGSANLEPSNGYMFTSIREELRVAGVYVRFYVTDSSTPLDDSYSFSLQLLAHIAHSRAACGAPVGSISGGAASAKAEEDNGEDGPPYAYEAVSADIASRHLRLALRALHLVLVNTSGSEAVIARDGAPYVPFLFRTLEKEGVDTATDGASELEAGHSSSMASHSTNKAAAQSGASAGAGGARSTPAPPNATLRELLLTVIAAFAPYEPCAGVAARAHLMPILIRLLPRDPGSFGALLRTFFSHSVVVAEMARIAALIDLLTIFAGGVASGPAPGRAGARATPASTIPKPARTSAGALISIMTSDGMNGLPLLMQLQQLMPEALAVALKESVSGATSAGTGTTGMAMTGVGAGAAGAGGTTGGLGDVVSAFDSDHETPELLWNAVCRHELRCALGELTNGLGNLRRKAAAANTPGGADGCGWSMPASFRVRYSVHEGELRVGGVYVRVFLKEPTFPLRSPKEFLEALLRRFTQEAEHLCGMTSDDAEKARAAAHAASEAAKAEEASGGVTVKTRADATGDAALVLRGEDVLTQVTHGIVCLLRVRTMLCDHANSLGYVNKLVAMLGMACGKAARYNLGVQCVRVLQVLASSKICVLAAAKANIFPLLMRSCTPVHRDAAFTLEAMKIMLETDTADTHTLVESALRSDAISWLVNVLEKEKLDHLVDPSAARVHAVAIIKILEADSMHGAGAAAQLQSAHATSWDKYRHQKHDLFLSRNDTRDYFLTDATSAPLFMLKNTAEWTGAPAAASAAPPPMAAAAAPPAAAAASAPPPLYASDASGPPPAPEYIAPAQLKFGGFQAPAPAPRELARAESASTMPLPASAAAAADPFDMFAAAPASASGAPIILGGPPAPAPASAGGVDPFADLLS